MCVCGPLQPSGSRWNKGWTRSPRMFSQRPRNSPTSCSRWPERNSAQPLRTVLEMALWKSCVHRYLQVQGAGAVTLSLSFDVVCCCAVQLVAELAGLTVDVMWLAVRTGRYDSQSFPRNRRLWAASNRFRPDRCSSTSTPNSISPRSWSEPLVIMTMVLLLLLLS